MGLFSWLIGRGERSARSGPLAHNMSIPDTGRHDVDVVGESRYQKALEHICGGRTRQSQRLEVVAQLVLEAGDRHDTKAVRVEIQGQTVGYLDRETARNLRTQLAEAGVVKGSVTCGAVIVGGWDRGGGDRGYFGVKLDLPTRAAKQATSLPLHEPKSSDGTPRRSRPFSRPAQPHQGRQRSTAARQPGRYRRRQKLILPWRTMLALGGLAALLYSYVGGVFFPNGESSGGCWIKGNISANGERIYHVPGGEYYIWTWINPVKGERWFCTEAEAQAAGWRRSRQ